MPRAFCKIIISRNDVMLPACHPITHNEHSIPMLSVVHISGYQCIPYVLGTLSYNPGADMWTGTLFDIGEDDYVRVDVETPQELEMYVTSMYKDIDALIEFGTPI